MDKLKMETPDLTEQNIDKIAAMFPHVITETLGTDGKLRRAVNFELLRQELSQEALAGDEAYEFTWVGKKASIVEANRPIRKTLRPCMEESKDWDTTENLYIEGDNLDVLKLLQESYLGKVKMIYIDPPYNTGHDFIYNDHFEMDRQEYDQQTGLWDEEESKTFSENNDTNPRFHSDWCSMIYPRLALARSLLSDDGVVFISIDDHEQENLKKMCNEIFGEHNCVGIGQWRRVEGKPGKSKYMGRTSEFVLIYAQHLESFDIGSLPISSDGLKEFRYEDSKGRFRRGQIFYPNRGIHHYTVVTPYGNAITGDFTIKQTVFNEHTNNDEIYWAEQGEHTPYLKVYLDSFEGTTPTNTFGKEYGSSQGAVKEFKSIFGVEVMYFDNPKPVKLLQRLLLIANLSKDSIALDFFSGSATTAHAVMQLNAEDGGRRKFIMVQLQEPCGKDSEAFKAGYKNICEIGKERIRRAGEKIKSEVEAANAQMKLDEEPKKVPDIGFRVLKLDDTNMKDVYYSADEYDQTMLKNMESNIKEDRSDLDLLFGCLLDWGLPLSLPYSSEKIDGCSVHTYNGGDLIACFDKNVPESVVREIAKRQPLRVVFRDSSFSSSPEKINVGEIFKLLSPATTVKVI